MKTRPLIPAFRATLAAASLIFGAQTEILADTPSPAMTLHWRGTTSNRASEPSNWAENLAPSMNSTIVLDGDSADMPMLWDIDDVVLANWNQSEDYTGTVTFQTGISRTASGSEKIAHGVLLQDGVTRVLKVTGDVTINGGTWTHKENPSMKSTDDAWKDGKGIWRLIAEIGGNYTLGATATNNVASQGYRAGQGPGHSPNTDAGASHGGLGARIGCNHSGLKTGLGNNCYGLVKQPETIGSGCAYGDRHGGGAVVLNVGGTALVEGTILAHAHNGNIAAGTTFGAGAGGSVYIRANKIVLTGSVCADGGIAGNCSPGGGGRIAFITTGDDADSMKVDLSRISAYGGRSTSFPSGYAGTIYLETATDGGRGELIVKDANYSNKEHCYGYGAQLWDPQADHDYDFSKVTMLNAADLVISPGVELKTDSIVSDTDTTIKYLFITGGRLNYTGPELSLTNMAFVGCLKETTKPGTHSHTGQVVVADGNGRFVCTSKSTFNIDGPFMISGDVQVASGQMTYTSHSKMLNPYKLTAITNRMDLIVEGDMTIDDGAAITADGIGFLANSGPGKPCYSGRVGGTHAGQGAFENNTKWNDGEHAPCYGSVRYPVTLGSGGDSMQSGGGAIKITIEGSLTVNGSISATGGQTAASNENGSRSGAGGSVWITAGSLAGSGTISANGGYTYHYADSCSGGGRVAVTLTEAAATFDDFFASGGIISAYGGKSRRNDTYAGAGTVYLRTGAQGDREGTLIIDNNGTSRKTGKTVFGSMVSDTEVGSVIVTNCAAAVFEKGSHLEFSDSWRVMPDSDITCEADSSVAVVGSGVSKFSGQTDFFNFTCTTPGKTLMFGTQDSLFTIASGGTLTIKGSEESPVVLKSDSPGTVWPMYFTPGAISDITYADISYSGNSGAIITADKSADSGNNTKWTSSQTLRPASTSGWGSRTPNGTTPLTGQQDARRSTAMKLSSTQISMKARSSPYYLRRARA